MDPLLKIHGAAMVLAAGLFITALIVARRRKAKWLLWHRALGALAVLVALAGLAAVVYFKMEAEYPHLQTTHARSGALALVLVTLALIFGAGLNFGHIRALRWPHRILGGIAVLLFLLTLACKIF